MYEERKPGTAIFRRFCHCQRPGSVYNFAVTRSVNDLVRQQRLDQTDIVCLLRFEPSLFKLGYGFLVVAFFWAAEKDAVANKSNVSTRH